MVELSGEAGVGKSRIVQTLMEAVAEEPYFRLSFQCSPHHVNSAYFPIIRQLERAAGFTSADDGDARLDKLEELLRRSGQNSDDAAPWIAALLSLPGEERYGTLEQTPEQRRERITKALMDQMLGLARVRPVLFVLEDAHWIDPTTREFVERLAPEIAEASVLVLITCRHEEARPLASLSRLTSVTLNRLSRAQGKKIIAAAGGADFPDDVIDQIVLRADGVPLYVEELTRSVAEAGGGASAADIPETLQASLTARLDRLVRSMLAKDPDHRPQTMAVVIAELDALADGSDLAGLIHRMQKPRVVEAKPAPSASGTATQRPPRLPPSCGAGRPP